MLEFSRCLLSGRTSAPTPMYVIRGAVGDGFPSTSGTKGEEVIPFPVMWVPRLWHICGTSVNPRRSGIPSLNTS